MKKLTSLLLALLLLVASMGSVAAATENIQVYLDGNAITFDVPPQTINSRTMVPIRAIFEAMGATVNWDENSQTAVCTKNGTTVKMTLNSTIEYINDTAFEMDIAPVIVENRTLAPARYVAEAFGYTVSWDDSTQTVSIATPAAPAPAPAMDTYEGILYAYTLKLQEAAPILVEEYKQEAAGISDVFTLASICTAKTTALASICTEGTSEMAGLMLKNGSSYAEYQEWATKLNNVYMDEATKISNAYMASCMQ